MSYRSPARSRRLARDPLGNRQLGSGGLDRPSSATPIVGPTVCCSGWAWPFPDERVGSVEIVVDGAPAIRARLTLRPDLSEALELPEAVLCGFEAQVPLPRDAVARGALRVSANVTGLAGGAWTLSAVTIPIDRASHPSLSTEHAAHGFVSDVQALRSGAAAPRSPRQDRDLLRRRLGYDPWHVVVLIDESVVIGSSGTAVAAMDVIAERHPNLELLITGVDPESVYADLLRRAIVGMGLEDRVTVPRVEEHPEHWAAVADVSLEGADGGDLGATVAELATIARKGPALGPPSMPAGPRGSAPQGDSQAVTQ